MFTWGGTWLSLLSQSNPATNRNCKSSLDHQGLLVDHFLTPTLVLAILITDPTTRKKLRGTTFLTWKFWPTQAGIYASNPLTLDLTVVKTLNIVLLTSRDRYCFTSWTRNRKLEVAELEWLRRALGSGHHPCQNHVQEDGGWTPNGGGIHTNWWSSRSSRDRCSASACGLQGGQQARIGGGNEEEDDEQSSDAGGSTLSCTIYGGPWNSQPHCGLLAAWSVGKITVVCEFRVWDCIFPVEKALFPAATTAPGSWSVVSKFQVQPVTLMFISFGLF